MTRRTHRTLTRLAITPAFAQLWAASAASNLGDGIALVAAPLLAATLTGDPTRVAGLAVAQQLPWLLFALVSGALADRLDRRRLLVLAGLCRAGLIGGLGVAVLSGRATLPLLYAAFFLLGTGETLFDTTAAAAVPAVVPPADLPRANARLAGTVTVANYFVGKPLGGLLFTAGAALPFLVGAGGWAATTLLIMALRAIARPTTHAGGPPPTLWAAIGAGVHWLWGQRLLRTLALTLALLNVTFAGWNAILVLYATQRLGLPPAGFGALLTAHAAGAVAGSAIAGPLAARLGAATILRLALVVEAAMPALLALAPNPALAGAALALFGAHALVWGAILVALRQELTPPGLRGRVESAYRLLEYGGGPPGALMGGFLAARLGLTAPFWLAAVVGASLLPLAWPAFSPANVAAARVAAHAAANESAD